MRKVLLSVLMVASQRALERKKKRRRSFLFACRGTREPERRAAAAVAAFTTSDCLILFPNKGGDNGTCNRGKGNFYSTHDPKLDQASTAAATAVRLQRDSGCHSSKTIQLLKTSSAVPLTWAVSSFISCEISASIFNS